MIRRFLYLILATVILGGLAGGLYYYAFIFKPKMIAGFIASTPKPVETVSAAEVKTESWQPQISGIGTLVATDGIDITPQIGGVVQKIQFDSGQKVKKGDLLVELDHDTADATLRSLEAQLTNAQSDLDRRQGLADKGLAPRTEIDQLRSQRDSLKAQADQAKALIDQKFIYAPWDGTVGLRAISLGSYVAPGQKIVWLQKTDPIYADFTVTEADYGRIKDGQPVAATFNAYPGDTFSGTVKTTDSKMSDSTRMITVRATLGNADGRLLPGMYANVLVDVGSPEQVMTVPQTAVVFSLYGDNVFVAVPAKSPPAGATGKVYDIERHFVKVGPVRNGQISIVSGLKTGDQVVTTGQNKIDQGSMVTIDNSVALKITEPNTIQ